MTDDEIDRHCLALPGAIKEFKAEWGAHRFLVADKMFGLRGTDAQGREILTLKCVPDFGRHLRDTYPDVVPGYYMNKEHWNSVVLTGAVPDEVVAQMITMSHDLVLAALPKKVREGIAR